MKTVPLIQCLISGAVSGATHQKQTSALISLSNKLSAYIGHISGSISARVCVCDYVDIGARLARPDDKIKKKEHTEHEESGAFIKSSVRARVPTIESGQPFCHYCCPRID